MFKFIKEPISLAGKILLVNAISPGHVPTYAFDHLIALNDFKRVAFLQSDHLEPSVGYLPSEIEGGALGLPGELYLSGDVSTLRFSRKKDFVKQISALVEQHKFQGVVVVGSLPYSIKHDREIGSLYKNIYYQVKGVQCESIKIKKCAEMGYAQPVDELRDQDEQEDIVVKNAGLCAALLKQLKSVLLLLVFNQEIEDRKTGIFLAKELNKFVDRKQISRVK